MINPLIISRLIEGGYRVYLPVDGSSVIMVVRDGECEHHLILCANVSQDKAGSPILKCPVGAMMVAACDVVTRTVWIIPSIHVEGKKNLRLGEEMEEFIVPEPQSPSFKEAREMRRRRLEGVAEDVRKSIEKFKSKEDQSWQ